MVFKDLLKPSLVRRHLTSIRDSTPYVSFLGEESTVKITSD